jgi:hypothetical protein
MADNQQEAIDAAAVEEFVAAITARGYDFTQMVRERLQEVAPKRRSIRGKRARRVL